MMNTFTKSIFLIIISSLSCFKGITQKDTVKPKRFYYGIHIGANYSIVETRQELPPNSFTYNGWGYKVGWDFGYLVGERLFVNPTVTFSLNKCGVEQTRNTEINRYEVYQGALEVAALLRFSLFNNPSVYLVAGPSMRFPIQVGESNTTTFTTDSGSSVDCGVGLSHRIGRYMIAPEIRYSHGLTNINANPVYRDLRYNNVSFVLNFRI